MAPRKGRSQSNLSKGDLNDVDQSQQVSADEPAPEAEAATVVPEVVEELTEGELEDKHRLELKVERAFVEAGKALRELRDRRLYRNTHKTFEEYCRQLVAGFV